MLPKTLGFYKVSMEENVQQLFDLHAKVYKLCPYILSFGTHKKILEFFTVEHKSDIYIYNDDKGDLIGFISVIYMPNEIAMELLAIVIDPIFQRHGYGKEMMVFAEGLAKKAGLIKIRLVANIKNIPAVEFYKNIGYKIIKEVKNYYGNGQTRYIFEKKIS